MIPSHTWFPSSLIARAAWFANFALQFNTNYALVLTLGAYSTAVEHDNDAFQSIAASRTGATSFDRAMGDFLKEITEGEIGSPQPVFPLEDFAAPALMVTAGIFQRLDELRALIMAQPTYTIAMGTAMGIEGSSTAKPIPADVKPDIDTFAAKTDAHFSLVVTGRGEATMWDVYILRKGGTWTKIETASGKSADIYVPLTNPGEPEQIQVRVQLRKNNANYGQPSEPAYVTLNP